MGSNPSSSREFISTAEAAQALGVSVSTVKRWVEEGILPAEKTAGGHRKLLLADVVELARQGKLPARNLARLKLRFSKRRPATSPQLKESLYEQLSAGDAAGVRSVIQGAYQSGMSIASLADEVIAPAMHRVGRDWESGRIDVMHEHRASQVCAAALFELKAVLEDRAFRDRPVAVGGALEGDFSVLPSLLAEMVLLDSGWKAVNLGANTPLASFCRAIDELRPQLLWISLSHSPVPDFLGAFADDYGELYRHAQQAGTAVVIGGRAMVEEVRAKIPYTAYGDGLRHLAAFAATINPRPHRPRRGRPRGT